MKSRYTWSLKRAFAVMVPLFFLNWIGVVYSLYSILWWWDVMTHFLGGVFIFFLLLAIWERMKWVDKVNSLQRLAVCALIIFVGWEVYEVIINIIIPSYKLDMIDTAHDVINDTLGALVAYYWYRQFGSR